MQNEQKTNQNLIKWVFRIGLILVDIFIVNFSYYLALLLRFYVNHQFNPEAVPYIPLFYRFALSSNSTTVYGALRESTTPTGS